MKLILSLHLSVDLLSVYISISLLNYIFVCLSYITQNKSINPHDLKNDGEIFPSLLEYRYNRLHQLLPPSSQIPQLFHSGGGVHNTPDSMTSHIGCTPIVEAIKSDEYRQQGRERVINSIKKEQERMPSELTSDKPQSLHTSCVNHDSKQRLNPLSNKEDHAIVNKQTARSYNTRSIAHKQQRTAMKQIHNSENDEMIGKDLTIQSGTKCVPTTPLSTGEGGSCGIKGIEMTSEEARKLRQAQQRLRKEEWQRKHNIQKNGSGDITEENVVSDGVENLITNGMYLCM